MIKTLNSLRVVGLITLMAAFVGACQNESAKESMAVRTQQSASAAQDNNQMLGVMQDVAGVTAGAFSSQGISGGRAASEGDEHDYGCHPTITNNIKVVKSNRDSLVLSGSIIIDFGDGSGCADSVEVRKGKIIDSLMLVITFKDTVKFNSFESITFIGYEKDSVQLDGSITITAATGMPTVIKVNETRTHFGDGSSILWKGDLVFTINKVYGHQGYHVSSVSITGSWSGTSRHGDAFSATITTPVVYMADCFGHRHKLIPVSGVVDVTTKGVTSTINYGDGTCDRVYTITTAGVTTEYKFG